MRATVYLMPNIKKTFIKLRQELIFALIFYHIELN